MLQAAHFEIQRLRRLHQGADLELQLLQARSHLTLAEETQRLDLKKRKLQLKDRIAWFESVLREEERPASNDSARRIAAEDSAAE